jgi:RHS repeat-associated protein
MLECQSGDRLNRVLPLTYLPYGPLSGLTYGNSKTLSASYDQDYRPTNRTVAGVFNHTYDTDNDGNITQKGVRTYTYDVLERLNAEAGGTATSFTYDAIGNRLTETAGGTTNYTYPATNSKVTSVGANSYTYDSAGNITGDTARTYVWSAAGLLKEVKIGGTTVGTYTYSANNQRTKKVAGGTTTHYVYGLGGKLSGEYDNAGVLIREYVYLNGEPLAQIDKTGGTETVAYLHTDHLATPRYGTNAAGTTVWTWDSGAFGKEAPTGSATVNLRFPGQYFDAETTLFYNWNRYYNPAIGRYISSDPIGLAGGFATYNYVSVSPVMFSDPRGLLSDTPFCPSGICKIRKHSGTTSDGRKIEGPFIEAYVYTDDGQFLIPVYVSLPTNDPGLKSNCHGCAYANCAFWIQGDTDTIEAIRAGDGYVPVELGDAAPGDVVTFDDAPWFPWNETEGYDHSATVTSNDNGNISTSEDNNADRGPVPGTVADSQKKYGGAVEVHRKQ